MIGRKVMFGHLLLDGERSGTIVDHSLAGWTVAVDFLPSDGEHNPEGKRIAGCKWYDEKPSLLGIEWQYCYPIPE